MTGPGPAHDGPMTGLGVALGLLSAAVFGVAAVIQAHAVRQFETSPDTLIGFVARAVRDGRTWVVVVAYLVGFALHAVAIWLLPLYLAQATIAMQLPVTALASTRLEASLGTGRLAAIAVVTFGLVLLTLGAGGAGDVVEARGRFAVAAWVGVALLGVLSLAARQLTSAALGLLAGLGYAGSALSVRGVGTPLDLAVVVTALAVPAYGLLAFWLYSLGLRKAHVATSTGVLIVVQTFVPAAVGVALLGDGVRPGWWPAVVAGLLLATAGSVALTRTPTAGSEVPALG
jgi:hypothetical protein